ncbi:MAG: hypothetical protein H3C47_07805 [Candidatus Cloacimonetes bacterium]|nr:hypothetical protein [Candidatus Cloacimonadota bacterium]
MSNKNYTQEFDGKIFRIAQSGGRCCESGCDGCELYRYKVDNGLPVQSSRLKFFQDLANPKKDETK